MDFDKCKYPYNHYAKQDTENLHNPKSWAPFQVVSSFLCLYPIARQHLLWFLTQCINLPLLETHVNEIIHNVYHVRLLSPSIMLFFSFLKIHSCYVLVIYFISEWCVLFWIYHNLFLYPAIDGYLWFFSLNNILWTFWTKFFKIYIYISLFFLSKHLGIGLQNHRVYA